MNNYIINQMDNCYMSSDEEKASQIKILGKRLSFNWFLKVQLNFSWHKREYASDPTWSLGQIEHKRISVLDLHNRVSGLRSIQTVAQNSQKLHFGIRHSWNHISVSFVGMKV